MCVHVLVYVYVYIYIYIYVYSFIYMYLCMYVCACVCLCMRVCIHMFYILHEEYSPKILTLLCCYLLHDEESCILDPRRGTSGGGRALYICCAEARACLPAAVPRGGASQYTACVWYLL